MLSLEELEEELKEKRVEKVFLTTVLLNRLAEEGRWEVGGVKEVLFGGEGADAVRVGRWWGSGRADTCGEGVWADGVYDVQHVA